MLFSLGLKLFHPSQGPVFFHRIFLTFSVTAQNVMKVPERLSFKTLLTFLCFPRKSAGRSGVLASIWNRSVGHALRVALPFVVITINTNGGWWENGRTRFHSQSNGDWKVVYSKFFIKRKQKKKTTGVFLQELRSIQCQWSRPSAAPRRERAPLLGEHFQISGDEEPICRGLQTH